jgi:hypothetical protein
VLLVAVSVAVSVLLPAITNSGDKMADKRHLIVRITGIIAGIFSYNKYT